MRLIRIICGPLSENCYITGADGTNECVVIDPGDAEPVISYLEEKKLRCTHILITHGHYDHIGGVAKLHAYSHAIVCIHELDAEMLKSSRSSLALMIGAAFEESDADVLLHDGDEFDAAGLHFLVLHTPGHSAGGVCYVLKAERVIFCGDTLFYESAGRTDFPGCSQKALYRSIVDKLYALEGDYEVLCGHETETSLAHERANNSFTQYGNRFQW